jgi:IS30 family transposase
MANQGRSLDHVQLAKIVTFLSSTDMTIAEIATRMGCSRSAVASVNRRNGIRDYGGLRAKWTVRSGSQNEQFMTSELSMR